MVYFHLLHLYQEYRSHYPVGASHVPCAVLLAETHSLCFSPWPSRRDRQPHLTVEGSERLGDLPEVLELLVRRMWIWIYFSDPKTQALSVMPGGLPPSLSHRMQLLALRFPLWFIIIWEAQKHLWGRTYPWDVILKTVSQVAFLQKLWPKPSRVLAAAAAKSENGSWGHRSFFSTHLPFFSPSWTDTWVFHLQGEDGLQHDPFNKTEDLAWCWK